MTPLGQIDHRIPHSHGCCSLLCCPSQQEQYATSWGTSWASRFCALLHYRSVHPGFFGVDKRSNPGTLLQFETLVHGAVHFARGSSARGFAVSSQVQQSVAFAFGGFVSCVHHRGRRGRAPSKPNVQSSTTMNNCSVTRFPQSPKHFGHQKQQRISPLPPIVRCAPRSSISPASESGPATRSQRSFPKFSSVIECATSA